MSRSSAGKVPERSSEVSDRIFPKTDVRHWKPRLVRRSYIRDGRRYEDPFCSVQIQFKGRRESFVLGTPNKDAAAQRAKEIFGSLLSVGWADTLAKFKPKTHRKPTPHDRPTVGIFLEAARAACPARDVSILAYSQAFRKLVSDIIGAGTKHAKPAARLAWRQKVDETPLESITPQKVEAWRIARIKKAGTEPSKLRGTKTTLNSVIRNSRALFSKAVLRNLEGALVLPSPLPLEGVCLEKKPKTQYQSKFDAGAIIVKAKDELAEADPESFKVLLLAVCCGLRVSEIDTLLWRSFDFDGRRLSIEANEFNALKSEDSAGAIELDAPMAALFRGYKARASGDFVIESGGSPRNRNEKRGYRIETVWRRTTVWLRANGVDDAKPIHALRKELGSLVNQRHGLVAAQKVLRHAHIATTASYYVDTKGSMSVGLGDLLAGTGKVITFLESGREQKEESKHSRRIRA